MKKRKKIVLTPIMDIRKFQLKKSEKVYVQEYISIIIIFLL